MSKVKRAQYETMDRAKEIVINDIRGKFEKEMNKIKSHLDIKMGLQKDPSLVTVSMQTRKKYADMDSVDVVVDVFDVCEDIFEAKKIKRAINRFLTHIGSDDLARLVSFISLFVLLLLCKQQYVYMTNMLIL